MSRAGRSRSVRRVVVAVSVVAFVAAALTAPGAWARSPDLARGVPVGDPGGTRVTAKLEPRLRAARGPVTAFVELDRPSAVDAYTAERSGGRAEARGAARAAKRTVAETARTILADLRARDPRARLLYRTANAIAGIAVVGDAREVRALASREEVRTVRTVVPKYRVNAGAAQLTRTLRSWQQTGLLGDGVRIGIIDDGIDYTHAHFGGPGTVAAYEAVDPDTADPEFFPTAKVVGGTDLVGDEYDSSGENGSVTPEPDPNPLSCGQHGTHVAGSAAGFGVDADGKTFRGDYASLTSEKVADLRIGPGMAPRALLHGIKVFGCHGSTEVTALALDSALDPDGDGDFRDRLDIVNLSLGSDFGGPDDPDALFIRKLARHGVLPVVSAGNGGDLYDVAGSPGTTPEALTVASSRDASVVRDAAEVTEPARLTGMVGGQYSQDYARFGGLDRTAPVVPLGKSNPDGCEPFSAGDSTAVKGKFVWLEWDSDDATRACGSFARAENAEAAGAKGVVLSSTDEHFAAGLAGNESAPMFQFTASVTRKLRPELDAGTLVVRLAGPLRTALPTTDDSIVDTPSDFTSRGVRGPAVKPDLSAPGDTITSAASGSGNGRVVMSGTSMAAPVTTGIAALVRQAHPEWSVEEVKAALINTAGHDLASTGGVRFGPQRVGSGRADARSALDTDVLAMVSGDRGAVSASFGVLEVTEPMSVSKKVRLANKGRVARTFSVGYEPITAMPGVRFTLSEDAVRVAPGRVAFVELTLVIDDPAALRKTVDPTVEPIQAGLARQFVADASGLVVFRSPERELRVPVHAAPKPSAAVASPRSIRFTGDRGEAELTLAGRGVDQGEGTQAYRSMVSVLRLHATSRMLPPCGGHRKDGCTVNRTARGGDLRYVGALSTAPLTRRQGSPEDALLGFGIATWGTWANLGGNTIPFVQTDIDGDDEPDFESYVTKAPGTDVLLVSTVDLHRPLEAGGFAEVDVQAVNGQLGDVDTNVFDSDVVVLPVRLTALGIDPAAESHRISYTVGVAGYYTAEDDADGLIDAVDRPLSFDALRPDYWVEGDGEPALSYLARPGATLVVHRTGGARMRRPVSLLTLHHHNAAGRRAALVRVLSGPPLPSVELG